MNMDAKILNLYNNCVVPNKNLKAGNGNCFLITIGDSKILFDTGYKGKTLINNVQALGVEIDKLDKIVLSHGHMDHSGGLPTLLKARTTATPIPIIGDPRVMEAKYLKIFFFYYPIGFPKLSEKLSRKITFQPTTEPMEVIPGLSTTGEIPLEERPNKAGFGGNMFHKVNGKRKEDIVIDDLSLVLKTKNGPVLLTGCCHAGLLNTCARVSKLYGKRIEAIIGGTHMLEYSNEDVDHVADVLKETFGSPKLYLNHCTGMDVIERLKNRFGSEVVNDFFAGSELTFSVS
jgi:7,8-dihydropterin-6-yl-methyl-4-(beta-D-ribofuranosyl)aminobenzene 5'-phosphate synthase